MKAFSPANPFCISLHSTGTENKQTNKPKELPFPLCLCLISKPATKLSGEDPRSVQHSASNTRNATSARLGSARPHGRSASAAVRAGPGRPPQHGDGSLLWELRHAAHVAGGGKMAAPVSVCHVACCANRVGGGVVSWGREGLLAFGSCRDVVLYQPAVSGAGRHGGAGLAAAARPDAGCFSSSRRPGGRWRRSEGTAAG